MVKAEEFNKCWQEIIKNEVFKYYTELPHFKIYHKKAAKFWNTDKESRVKSLEQFARGFVRQWWDKPEHYLDGRYFFINMANCYWIDGMSARTILSSVLVMAQNEVEPTITTAEAKKAAEYLQKHQAELLRHKAILERYLQQQGFTGSSMSLLRNLKGKYQKQEEEKGTNQYLIEPDLLRIVLRQQDTKTITAKRAVGSLLRLDPYVKSNPPVSAIAEFSNLMSDELVSDDTISRHVKLLNAMKIN